MKRNLIKIEVFNSFEEENDAEYKRLAVMSHEECLEEFEILQERVWGEDWTKKPMKKILSYEKINW